MTFNRILQINFNRLTVDVNDVTIYLYHGIMKYEGSPINEGCI